MSDYTFNPPPGWPPPPKGWRPDPDWQPDPSWPPAPPGWQFWTLPPAESEAHVPNGEDHAADLEHVPPEATGQAEATADEPTAGEPTASVLEEPQEQPWTEPEEAPPADSDGPSAADHATTQSLAPSVDLIAAGTEVDPEAARSSETELQDLEEQIAQRRRELVELDDAVLLQQVGIYEYHHPLENAEEYKDRLKDLKETIRDSVRERAAINSSDRFAYNNSLAQGRKMTRDFSKLMLRAYNAEADSCVRSLRAGSIQVAIQRLERCMETVARLGSMMELKVSPEYHALRVQELELTSDYLFKLQEEREAAREERARLREERRAEQELAAERERLDKERSHYENSLERLRSIGSAEEVADLEKRMAQIDEAIEQNDYRAANIRAGYVYVISNVGTFGPNVVKIGMTRRLDPMDRVRELGDASVPFPFDVHAIYFSQDAITLETELHKEFAALRMNQVNLRREFFFATPAEVRDVLRTKVGALLEFTESPEAAQFHQSVGLWPETREREDAP